MFIKKSQVGKQLFCKHRFHFLNGLQFDNNLIVYKQIQPKRSFELIALVDDGDLNLSCHI